ncbi:MAG: DUF4058 family protein [Gemmataceae bacterium]
MPSPFPGMDPYLEAHWGDVHTGLVTYARDALQPQLPGDLLARIEEYIAVEEDEAKPRGYYPDVRVTEHCNGGGVTSQPAATVAVAEPVIVPLPTEAPTLHSLRVYDRNNRVITAIELLSPANKVGEAGRKAYRKKQQDLIEGAVSLVEIDLIREGNYILFPPEGRLPPDCRGPYRISVMRAGQFDRAEVYRVPLRQRLPAIRIPLRPADADVVLDLQPLIDRSYENGRYERDIDYRTDPMPPLSGDDAAWADALLREKQRRV